MSERHGIGDTTAHGAPERAGSFSRRAANQKLQVIRKKCPHCGHHKALHSVPSGRIKCSRCKQ